MISIRRPATLPPISSAALCAAITDPVPLPSAYCPLMSVMMPTRRTPSSARAGEVAESKARPSERSSLDDAAVMGFIGPPLRSCSDWEIVIAGIWRDCNAEGGPGCAPECAIESCCSTHPNWNWYGIAAPLKCAAGGSGVWVDRHLDWTAVNDLNKGVSRPREIENP